MCHLGGVLATIGGSRRPQFRDGRACGSKDLRELSWAPGGGDGALSIQLSISASNILCLLSAFGEALSGGLAPGMTDSFRMYYLTAVMLQH